MNMQERAKLRKLQDKIIAQCERIGIEDDARLSQDMPSHFTVGLIRQFLAIGYETELESVHHALATR